MKMKMIVWPVLLCVVAALGAHANNENKVGHTPNESVTHHANDRVPPISAIANSFGVGYGRIAPEDIPVVAVPLFDDVYFAFEFDAFWILEVDEMLEARAKAKECEVECESGAFACCFINGDGEPVCRCRANGSNDDDCQSGGSRSRSCRIVRTVDTHTNQD